MKSSSSRRASELTQAAEALEAELEGFERFSATLCSHALNSQKNIQKVATMLQEVAEMDQRMTGQVQNLVAAIHKAKDRQQAQAEAIQQRAIELQERVEKLKSLMQEYEALGKSAAELNQLLQSVGEARTNGSAGEADLQVHEMLDRMGSWADQAGALVDRSRAEEFPEIMRLADSLRHQVLSARNKAQLLLNRSVHA